MKYIKFFDVYFRLIINIVTTYFFSLLNALSIDENGTTADGKQHTVKLLKQSDIFGK